MHAGWWFNWDNLCSCKLEKSESVVGHAGQNILVEHVLKEKHGPKKTEDRHKETIIKHHVEKHY